MIDPDFRRSLSEAGKTVGSGGAASTWVRWRRRDAFAPRGGDRRTRRCIRSRDREREVGRRDAIAPASCPSCPNGAAVIQERRVDGDGYGRSAVRRWFPVSLDRI
jgi:hypothetical protein